MATACPPPEKLGQLLLGKLSNRESRQLEQHLLECQKCCDRVEQLSASDHLVAALRKGKHQASMPPVLQKVIQRAKQMPPGEETDASQQVETYLPSQDASRAQAMASRFPEEFNLLAPPQKPGEVGRLGGYRVLGVIGSGGMGVVFLAEDPQLQRTVALKVMKPSLARNPRAKERFLREARAMASVEHDCIVPIYQVGEEGGVPFIAMPLLRGQTLQEYLKRKKALPPLEAVRIARQVASALAAAHKRGLIHRDIKPANIWLEKNGRVRLLDFGLARPMGQDSDLTHTGAVVGTPNYMAPEQARGDKLDSRCDLFSLGAVLYHMLSGQRPFSGKTLAMVLAAVMQQEPPPLDQVMPGLPPELVRLVHRLLAKYPNQRPQSAAEVCRELVALEKRLQSAPKSQAAPSPPPPPGQPAPAQSTSGASPPAPPGPFPQPPLHPRRKPLSRRIDPLTWFLFLAGGMAALVLLAMMAVFFLRTDKGVIRVEINDPQVEVQLKGTNITLRGVQGGKDIQVEPGSHAVVVRRGDFQFETNRLILRRGQRVTVRVDYIQGQVVVRQGTRELARAQVPQDRPEEPSQPGDTSSSAPSGKNSAAEEGSSQSETENDIPRIPNPDPASTSELPANKPPQTASKPDAGPMSLAQKGDSVPSTPPPPPREPVEQLGPGGVIQSVAFSPDGRFVLIGSSETAVLWDTRAGEQIRTFNGHVHSVTSTAFSPDGRFMLTGSWDNTAILWDTRTGKQLRTFRGHSLGVASVAFSPDGRFVVTGSGDKTAILWNVRTGKSVRIFRGHSRNVSSVTFSPDGRFVLTGSWDKTAILWDVRTGRRLRTFVGHARDIKSVALSPDGRFVLTGSYDKTAILWNARTGQPLRTFEGHSGPVNSVAFSPDGRFVFTGSRKAILWDIATGEQLRTFTGHRFGVGSVAFSPDGRFVVTGSGGTSLIILWDARTGEQLRSLRGYFKVVNSVAFSPDGRFVLTGSDDKTAILWNAWRGENIRIFRGHFWDVESAVFRPDGRLVVTGSWDGSARVWDVETGQELLRWWHLENGGWLAVTPQGYFTGSQDALHLVRHRDSETGQLIPAEESLRYHRPEKVAEALAGR